MAENYQVVPLWQLGRLGLSCTCGMRLSFDVLDAKQEPPTKCDRCGNEFGTDPGVIISAVKHYREFYNGMQKLNLGAHFLLPKA